MRKILIISCLAILFLACEERKESSDAASKREFYQLKIYTCKNDSQVQRVDQFLENAYMPAIKRLGISSIGVFKERKVEIDTATKIYVFFALNSIQDVADLEDRLFADSEFLNSGKNYLESEHSDPPYERIESTILKAFTDMPQMEVPSFTNDRSDRVYELRSYESATEQLYRSKVDMFNAGGEILLFDRLGFNAVFYGEVLSGAKMPNLIYMTTFPDMATRDSLWNEFGASQEWTELKKIEKYKNTVSKADKLLLYPTAYSDY